MTRKSQFEVFSQSQGSGHCYTLVATAIIMQFFMLQYSTQCFISHIPTSTLPHCATDAVSIAICILQLEDCTIVHLLMCPVPIFGSVRLSGMLYVGFSSFLTEEGFSILAASYIPYTQKFLRGERFHQFRHLLWCSLAKFLSC